MTEPRVAVIGAGTIGSDVALDLALHGFRVILKDVDTKTLDAARQKMSASHRLAKMLKKDQSLPPLDVALERIDFSDGDTDFGGIDVVIENITEHIDAKQRLYRELAEVCPADAIYAANTSCISITKLGACVPEPARMVGMHFMNPVPLSKMVEVVRGLHTSDDTIERARRLAERLGKTCIVVNDMPGFITNRVMMPMINECIWLVHDRVAEPAAVDMTFKLGFGHKMGPLATADLIGLDTILDSILVLYESYRDPKYRPCPLLIKMVEGGRLGKKSGRGFFNYAKPRGA